jgi:hypothetical protein
MRCFSRAKRDAVVDGFHARRLDSVNLYAMPAYLFGDCEDMIGQTRE